MSSVRFNDDNFIEAMTQRDRSGSFRVGALTTYEALVSGGDRKKEILLRRGKGNVDKIMADIIREMVQQKLASIHYEAMSNYVLFMPTMLITLSSAALSILATSDLFEDSKIKTKLTILVAFLQLCLATLQSLSKQLDFGAKAGFHRSAARTLQKIHQNAKHRQYESRYQSIFRALKQNKRLSIGFNVLEGVKEGSHESSDSDSDDESHIRFSESTETQPTQNGPVAAAEEPHPPPSPPPPPKVEHETHEEDHSKKRNGKNQVSESDSLGKQFKQAVEQVESIVPPRIANAFNVLESRIRVQNESLMTNKNNSLVAWEQVLPALYFQLSETIIESTGWPFFLPLPSKSVEKTLKDFKDSLDVDKENNADLLMDILDRSTDIFTVQKRLARKREVKEIKRRVTEMNDHHLQQAIKELEHEINFDDSHQWANESQPLLSHAV